MYYLILKPQQESLSSYHVFKIEPFIELYFSYLEIPALLKTMCTLVNTISFGMDEFEASQYVNSDIFLLLNPDVSKLTLPITNLKRILIYTETYDFYRIKYFIPYAVNYIGQEHLKNKTEFHIYGHPEKLHPNLYKNLTNLCQHVYLHKEDELQIPTST